MEAIVKTYQITIKASDFAHKNAKNVVDYLKQIIQKSIFINNIFMRTIRRIEVEEIGQDDGR